MQCIFGLFGLSWEEALGGWQCEKGSFKVGLSYAFLRYIIQPLVVVLES